MGCRAAYQQAVLRIFAACRSLTCVSVGLLHKEHYGYGHKLPQLDEQTMTTILQAGGCACSSDSVSALSLFRTFRSWCACVGLPLKTLVLNLATRDLISLLALSSSSLEFLELDSHTVVMTECDEPLSVTLPKLVSLRGLVSRGEFRGEWRLPPSVTELFVDSDHGCCPDVVATGLEVLSGPFVEQDLLGLLRSNHATLRNLQVFDVAPHVSAGASASLFRRKLWTR